MNIQQGLQLTIIVMTASLIIGCNSTYSNKAPEVSPEGLQLQKSTRATVAYKKEAVDFASYNSVQILPSKVAFKKDWQRNYNRNNISLSSRVTDADVLRIKADVAKLFDEVFKEEFGKDASFPIVDTVSSNTLVIRPAIINLDVTAPDLRSAANVRTYSDDTGQATLFLELYDGVSGEILARIINTAVAGDNSHYEWANRVTNRADAKRMIRKWAKALRMKYDEAHNKQSH
jgi:hypothetical protein